MRLLLGGGADDAADVFPPLPRLMFPFVVQFRVPPVVLLLAILRGPLL